MCQLVKSPTFTSGSLLDVCMVTSPSIVSDCRVTFCDFSPHHIVRLHAAVPRARRRPVITHSRCLKRLNHDDFLLDLYRADWSRVFSLPTVSEKWNVFLSIFMPVLDKHASMRSVRVRNPTAPPISAATRDLMCRRRAALRAGGRSAPEYRQLVPCELPSAVIPDRVSRRVSGSAGRGPPGGACGGLWLASALAHRCYLSYPARS